VNDVSFAKPRVTQYGFNFGPMDVEAIAAMDDGRVCISIKTTAGQHIEVYSSPTGRSLRVFKRGSGEMKTP
jgi:hypothetical protein